MKIVKNGLAALLLVGLVLAVVAPVGPVPGFFIGGAATPVPEEWQDTSEVHEIQLSVGEGLLPRVVIIWVVQVEGTLYVVGANDSGWTTRIGQASAVRMRLGDATYDLNATRISDGWEPVLAAYVAKYQPDYPDIVAGFPSADEAAATTAVFRLD